MYKYKKKQDSIHMTNAVKNRVTTPERKATPLVINGDMNIAQRII